jgi:hypothetical protein
MPIGPSLPPHLAHLSARDSSGEAGPSVRSTTPPAPHDAESESDGDDYGPALPPQLAAKRAAGPTLAPPVNAAAPNRSAQDDDEDSDDDIGPRPPGQEEARQEKSAVEEFLEREKRRAEQLEEKERPKALKREEWMLVPPEAGILSVGTSFSGMIGASEKLISKWTRLERGQLRLTGARRRWSWTTRHGPRPLRKSIRG